MQESEGKNFISVICKIKQIPLQGNDIEYELKTQNFEELIGNPIINKSNNKIIGMQKLSCKGIILMEPIKEFVENMKEELEDKNSL